MTICEMMESYPLDELLKCAGMPRSTFFYRKQSMNGRSRRRTLSERVRQVFYEDGREFYGCRKIAAVINGDERDDLHCNFKTVNKIMNELSLKCKYRPKKRSYKKTEENAEAPNHLNRDFSSREPMEKLVTDVTELATPYGKLYLSPIMDLYDNLVVAHTISRYNDSEMVMGMMQGLAEMVPELKDGTVLVHSDQGGLYRTKAYLSFAEEHGIIRSMSRKGNCYDNAVIESYFGDLKEFIGNLYGCKSVDEAISRINEAVRYFNDDRIMLKLGGLSPRAYLEKHMKNFSGVCPSGRGRKAPKSENTAQTENASSL